MLTFQRQGSRTAKPRAQQIPGYRIDPISDHGRVAKLVPVLPAAHPGGLGDFLRVFDRRAAGQQKPPRGVIASPVRLAVVNSFHSHRSLTVAIALPAWNLVVSISYGAITTTV